jgi:type II secretory pathway pseudopilin PulG
MDRAHRTQAGDSLIEIIFAIVVIGLVVSAITAAISTSENGSAAHRQLVTADTVMRDYAEAVKQAVRSTCTSAGGTWSTGSFTPVTGYTATTPSSHTCPDVTTTAVVRLDVGLPNGGTKSMDIAVRTP